jgi:TonB-linked SusC/RagA family outer membrane protein
MKNRVNLFRTAGAFLTAWVLIATMPVAQAQTEKDGKVTVKGSVEDTFGPVAGANVVEKGTSNGTITDAEGQFSLTAPADAVFIVSFIGYESNEVPIGGRTTLAIVLKEDSEALEEVVVVGYGVQKKVNLTGSVAAIGSERLESRATPNLSSSLAGLASGVTVRQSSGNPGSDGASIRIRGTGTFNSDYRGPMVIIDGAEGSMDSVNPDDVETISVLKDAASAAIYGSRAANGVILITTKKGKRQAGAGPHISYSGIFSSEQPATNFNFLSDYATYMRLTNRAQYNVNPNATLRYAQTTIDAWEAASKEPNSLTDWVLMGGGVNLLPNYVAYPNTDWIDVLFNPAFAQKHTLSVNGGSETSTYLLSLACLDNPGTMENTGLQRYQIRANVETRVGDILRIGTQTYAIRQTKEAGDYEGAFTGLLQSIPGVYPRYNGIYGGAEAAEENPGANNLLAFLNMRDGQNVVARLNTTWYAALDLYKGLTAETRFNFQDYRSDTDHHAAYAPAYSLRTGAVIKPGKSLSDAVISYKNSRSYNYTSTTTLNYLASFGGHDVSALLGYEQYYYNLRDNNSARRGMVDFSITDIATAAEMYEVGGSQSDYAMISFFGRLNYAYKNRYLFEANFRRDGSSRFAPENRWGTFPSFSAAWRLSEEEFLADGPFSNLKLRASWGQLGNTTSGYYDWQAAYETQNVSFGGVVTKGLKQGKIANPLLQWESITSSGVGIDAAVLDQRLSLELDLYDKLTEGILTSPSIYLTMGNVSPPTKNTSDMHNRGVEFTLGWNDRIGDFRYSLKGNFSYNTNTIVSYLGKLEEGWVEEDGRQVYKSNLAEVSSVDGTTIRLEGHPIDEFYVRTRYTGSGTYKTVDGQVDPAGGPRDGMIRTPEDLQWVRDMQEAGYSFNTNTVGSTGTWYGELIMADLNGDKIYGNTYDRQFTGKSAQPKYAFGLTASAAWKGFDFSMTWAGNAGMYYYTYERGINSSQLYECEVLPVDALTKYYYYNEANPDDPENNINAPLPRLRFASNGAYVANDFYLYNASYLKLKALQVGYSFPAGLVKKAHLQNLRLFVTGENLLTITPFDGVDPELGNGLNIYPTSRILSAGINISF